MGESNNQATGLTVSAGANVKFYGCTFKVHAGNEEIRSNGNTTENIFRNRNPNADRVAISEGANMTGSQSKIDNKMEEENSSGKGKEEESFLDEEKEFFSAFEEYFSDDGVQLSDSIWMFRDKRISTQREIYEGELRSGAHSLPIVLKLVENIPQSITEARILKKLNHHSHILSLICADTFDCGFFDQYYIATEKCHRENLRQYVIHRKRQGFAFSLSQAIDIAKQMVDGVKYIHENRIIHKDLKPDNILFSLDQKLIKIADFGVSQEIDSTSTEVYEKGHFGTNGFRPPESFGGGVISQKSDIFSLGVTFYFVLSNGRHPFGEDPDNWNYCMQNYCTKDGKLDLSGLRLRVQNIKTTEHLIKSMVKHKINDRPTIWQVSEHPFWTGNEAPCDFDYHCPESSPSLIPQTSKEPHYNFDHLYEIQEFADKISLRDEASAAKTRQRYKDGDQDLTSSGTKPDLTAEGAEVQVKLTTEEADSTQPKDLPEVTLSARVGVDQKEGMPDITPTFECNTPVTFEKPISMTMRTSTSAPAGKEIRVSLLTRDHPGDEWKETQQLSLRQRNKVVKLITGFNIHVETGMTLVTFSKDQAIHDILRKSMHENGFVDLTLIPHYVLAKYGSEISISMERTEPKDTTKSKAYPSATFKLDEDYLQKGKHIVYFKFDPKPSDQCRTISMQYSYKVNGELEGHIPLTTRWPRKDTKRASNDVGFKLGDGAAATFNTCNYNVHVHGGDQVHDGDTAPAVGFELGAQGTVNVKSNVDVHEGAKGGQKVEEGDKGKKKNKSKLTSKFKKFWR